MVYLISFINDKEINQMKFFLSNWNFWNLLLIRYEAFDAMNVLAVQSAFDKT